MDADNGGLELLVAHGAGRRGPALGLVVGGWGELQDLADRLDPEPFLVAFDVSDYLFCWR